MTEYKNPYDRSAKVLSRVRPRDFLDLVFPGIEAQEIRIESADLDVPEKGADQVFIIREEAAVAVEFMIEPDRRRLKEFFVKTAMLTDVLRELEVLLVVYYLTPGKYKHIPESYEAAYRGVSVRFSFASVGLWEHRKEIEGGKYPALAPFLSLWSEGEEEVLKRVKELVKREPDRRVRADLLSAAAMVAGRVVKDKRWLLEFFREEWEMMKESSILEEMAKDSSFVRERVQEGKQQGIQQGREQGLEQGRVEALRKSVQEALELRFDVVPRELMEEISAISEPPMLEQLHRLAIKAASLEEFRQKLAKANGSG